jgi:hypothetical protein
MIADERRHQTFFLARSWIAIIYVALAALLALQWSFGKVDEQLRMQPKAGECGGVLLPADGAPQGEAKDCRLVSWRVAGLAATSIVLTLPMFLVPAVLFVPLGRVLSGLRGTLFTILALSFAAAWALIAAALDHNPQGEFCRYGDQGEQFAPWSAQGSPCSPEWAHLAVYWAGLAAAALLVLGLPTILLVVVLRRWRRGH